VRQSKQEGRGREHYGIRNLTGHYADLAVALGAQAEKVEKPAEVIPAIQRGFKANADGRSARVKTITGEEELSKLW
jgi:thiamine pyrophosphate-dependent acetolactate synthase large subunit-like protein